MGQNKEQGLSGMSQAGWAGGGFWALSMGAQGGEEKPCSASPASLLPALSSVTG